MNKEKTLLELLKLSIERIDKEKGNNEQVRKKTNCCRSAYCLL